MSPPPNNRILLLAAGAAAALVVGVVLAVALGGRSEPDEPTTGVSGLVVESHTPDNKMDPARPLRCFVSGQLVGELTLSECAQRNGVAAGSLDVGIDESGQLSAADAAGTLFTPLPPGEEPPVAAPSAPVPAEPVAGPVQRASTGVCWRYEGGWQRVGELTLPGCVQTLYAGRCERPGAASYGRWGEQTLRLVPRRVEVSSDGRSFRTLADQTADCILGPVAG